MLLRHGWLAPLLKIPTITEDEEAEKAAEAGTDQNSNATNDLSSTNLHPETADKEIADWVIAAIERKLAGKMAKAEKPALHAVALDAVPRGNGAMMDHGADEPAARKSIDGLNADEAGLNAVTAPETPIKPNPGIKVESPELNIANIETIDFANAPSAGTSPEESSSNGNSKE